jgi:hypothetical protein
VAALARRAGVRKRASFLLETERETPTKARRGFDTLAIAALVVVIIFCYWGFLSGRSFIWDDTLTEYYPGVNYFAKSIHTGRFPLWFPGVRDGLPFYCDPQITAFYPPQWLLVPFVKNSRLPFLIYQRYIVLHYLLGGLFTYGFLRQRKLNPMAALGGALVFCLSGFASLHLVNFVIIQTCIWLPLQLLFVDRLFAGKSRWGRLGLIGAMTMSLLAGHPQTTVYCWYLVVAYWFYRSYSSCREPGVVKDALRLIGTFVLVFGLSAYLLIPAAQNWWRTKRSSLPFEATADTSLPRRELLTLFVPNFFGITKSLDSPIPFWGFDPHSPSVIGNSPVNAKPGYWQYWEFGIYAGQIFWLGLLLLLFNWRKLEDRSTVVFFLVTWVIAIWFALGRYGGLFQVLYRILPGVSFFRGPAKMSVVSTFAAAVITGYAVDLLAQRPRGLRCSPILLMVGICACCAVALYAGAGGLIDGLRNHPEQLVWARQETLIALVLTIIGALAVIGAARFSTDGLRSSCIGALLIVCVADFHMAYENFQRGNVSPDAYFPVTDKLLPLLQDYRETRGSFRFGQTNRGRISEEIATFRNLPYFHDFLEVPEGYTSFYLDNVAEFQAITNEAAKIAIQNIIISMDRDENGKDWLGTRTNSFPRAKFFARVRRYDSRETLLAALQKGEINWQHEAAVTDPDILPLSGEERSEDQVHFESLSPESYSVSYHVTQPGIILISQTYYPGWYIVNAWPKVVEVFGAFQGIEIREGGEGQFMVRFSPPTWKLGIAVSLITVLVLILLTSRRDVSPSLPPADEFPPSTDRIVWV